jgi:hypothetical protein
MAEKWQLSKKNTNLNSGATPVQPMSVKHMKMFASHSTEEHSHKPASCTLPSFGTISVFSTDSLDGSVLVNLKREMSEKTDGEIHRGCDPISIFPKSRFVSIRGHSWLFVGDCGVIVSHLSTCPTWTTLADAVHLHSLFTRRVSLWSSAVSGKEAKGAGKSGVSSLRHVCDSDVFWCPVTGESKTAAGWFTLCLNHCCNCVLSTELRFVWFAAGSVQDDGAGDDRGLESDMDGENIVFIF